VFAARFFLAGALLLTPFGATTVTRAATITVTTVADELNNDGDCSLREAIQAVNTRASVDACPAGTGNDLIVLPAGAYVLGIAGQNEDLNATGDLDVFPFTSLGGTVTIQGAGVGATIIDGNELDRVFHLIRSDSTLILRDLTVRNGKLTNAAGAGMLSLGALELRMVVIENNSIDGTSSSATGGGFCIGCGAGTDSGLLENVVMRNNSAARGGAIFSNRPLTITATSIISNTATAGGAIENYGDLSLINSTVSGNVATSNVGGVRHNDKALSLVNTTIAYNARGGVMVWEPTSSYTPTAVVKNSIIAFNAGGPWQNCIGSGLVTSGGNNLSDDTSCASWLTASGDLNAVDPLLSPLRDNGGPTPTHGLQIGSPAVNAGTNVGCPATDQRGFTRPQGPRCDIGAFEVNVLYAPLTFRTAN
jgi:CSLREA domain-containing protein